LKIENGEEKRQRRGTEAAEIRREAEEREEDGGVWIGAGDGVGGGGGCGVWVQVGAERFDK
jgi:hypothetical protein